MAKFCGECGAPQDENSRFCGSCGAPMDQPPAPEAPIAPPADAQVPPYTEAPASAEAPAFAQAPPFGEAPPFAQQPMAPKVKKPRPKWMLPVIVAAAVIVAAGVGATIWLRSANQPEKVAEKFLSAMEAGDFAALSKVAEVDEDEFAFNEQSVQPLFLLYKEDESFRQQLADQLEMDVETLAKGKEPSDDALLSIDADENFLFTSHRVVLHLLDVKVFSDFGGVQVVLGLDTDLTIPTEKPLEDSDYSVFAPGYEAALGGESRFSDILPGRYEMRYSFTTAAGAVIEKTETITVDWYNRALYLSPELAVPTVYNDSEVEIQILQDGKELLVIPAGVEGYLAPLSPDAMLEARADVGQDEPMTQTFSADDYYINIAFQLCSLDVSNDYPFPIQVYRDGTLLQTIEGYDSDTVGGLPTGTELELRLMEEQGFFQPEKYVCEYENDYTYPEFTFTDETLAALEKAVKAHIDQTLTLYHAGDQAGLEALPASEVQALMLSELRNQKEAATPYTLRVDSYELELDDPDNVDEENGVPTLYPTYILRLNFTTTEGGGSDTGTDERYCDFNLHYQNGNWVVAEDSAYRY